MQRLCAVDALKYLDYSKRPFNMLHRAPDHHMAILFSVWSLCSRATVALPNGHVLALPGVFTSRAKVERQREGGNGLAGRKKRDWKGGGKEGVLDRRKESLLMMALLCSAHRASRSSAQPFPHSQQRTVCTYSQWTIFEAQTAWGHADACGEVFFKVPSSYRPGQCIWIHAPTELERA